MSKVEHKQKVLMVHNYYQIPGGEDTVVANEKKLLQDYGHEVVLYTRHNNELKGMSKLQKLALPFTTIFNPRTYRDIKKIIAEEKIEIVHVHNTLNLISPAVYYAAVKMKVPIVQTIHNFRLLCPGATFYRDGHICEDCVDKGLKCAVKHKCYRGSRAQTLICVINTWIHRKTGILKKLNYICLTDFNKKKLLQLKCIKPERVFVKPNCTYENDIGIHDETTQEKKCFVFVGRLDELKGIKRLFNDWKSVGNDNELIVCGDGPLWEWCKSFIRQNNISNIILKGKIDNASVKRTIASSKALVLPTLWYEGFPMTVVEAYSVGTPVIGSNIGNVGCLIEEDISGKKFEIDDPDGLIKVLEKDYSNLRETTYQLYRKKYSTNQIIRCLQDIYNTVSL